MNLKNVDLAKRDGHWRYTKPKGCHPSYSHWLRSQESSESSDCRDNEDTQNKFEGWIKLLDEFIKKCRVLFGECKDRREKGVSKERRGFAVEQRGRSGEEEEEVDLNCFKQKDDCVYEEREGV